MGDDFQEVPLYGIFEARAAVSGPLPPDPYGVHFALYFVRQQPTTPPSGDLAEGSSRAGLHVHGFFDASDSAFVVRFSPDIPGSWSWSSNESTLPALRGRRGSFVVAGIAVQDRGPVRAHGSRFLHADGSQHFSVGTTAYAWAHQDVATRRQTLETLRGSPFNKLRMTLLPKWCVLAE